LRFQLFLKRKERKRSAVAKRHRKEIKLTFRAALVRSESEADVISITLNPCEFNHM